MYKRQIPHHAANTSGNAATSTYAFNAESANISTTTKKLNTTNNGFVKTINGNGTFEITTIQSSDIPSSITANTSGNAKTADTATNATYASGMLNTNNTTGVVFVNGDDTFIIDSTFKPSTAGTADTATFAEGIVVPNPLPFGSDNQGYLKTTNSAGSLYEFHKTIPNEDLNMDICFNKLTVNNIDCNKTITASNITADLSGTAQFANRLNVSGSGYIQMDDKGNLSANTIATYHLPTEISCSNLTSTDINGTTATIGSVSIENNSVKSNVFIGALAGNAITATNATTATKADKLNPNKINDQNSFNSHSFLLSDSQGSITSRMLASNDLPSQIEASTTGNAGSATYAEALKITGTGIVTAIAGAGTYSSLKISSQISSEQLPNTIDASKISGTIANATTATYAQKVYNHSQQGIVTVDSTGNLSVRSLISDDIPHNKANTGGKADNAAKADKATTLDVSKAGFVKVDASGNITPGEIQPDDISTAVANAIVGSAATATHAYNLKGKIFYNSGSAGTANYQSKDCLLYTSPSPRD